MITLTKEGKTAFNIFDTDGDVVVMAADGSSQFAPVSVKALYQFLDEKEADGYAIAFGQTTNEATDAVVASTAKKSKKQQASEAEPQTVETVTETEPTT